MPNTLLFNLCNAVKLAGTSKEEVRKDLDLFLHQLVGDGVLPAAQIERLLEHAREVAS